jgi:hypothetical protein
MPIENFNLLVALLFSMLLFLFGVLLWFVQHINSVRRMPLLLRERYRLFSIRDELRRLYVSVQCKMIGGTEFHDEDFTEMETRINNAINVLPLLSRRFTYLYMEGPEMEQLIKEGENIRKNLLERYDATPIGKALKGIDERISDILYSAFCLNSPIYVTIHCVVGYWRRLSCQTDYQEWREREMSKILQQLMDIPVSVVDLVHSNLSVNSSRLLTDWSRMPEA